MKYQKSRESGLFQFSLYACTVCHLYRSINRSFTNVTRCPLHRNRRKAKNYHSQYLRKSCKTFRLSSRDIKGRPRSRVVRLRIILAFHIALIYYTQDFRVYEGTLDQPMPGPFPAPPFFFEAKALGTRLRTEKTVL